MCDFWFTYFLLNIIKTLVRNVQRSSMLLVSVWITIHIHWFRKLNRSSNSLIVTFTVSFNEISLAITVAYMQRARHEWLQNYESNHQSRFLRDFMRFQCDFKPPKKYLKSTIAVDSMWFLGISYDFNWFVDFNWFQLKRFDDFTNEWHLVVDLEFVNYIDQNQDPDSENYETVNLDTWNYGVIYFDVKNYEEIDLDF